MVAMNTTIHTSLLLVLLASSAAVASAQTSVSGQSAATPAGLSYNHVSVSYSRIGVSGVSGRADSHGLTANALVGSSNVLVSASTTIGGDLGNGTDEVSVGYVFKNLAYGTDAILQVGSDETYGVVLRKKLGHDLEVSAHYTRTAGANVYGLFVGYDVTKAVTFGLAYERSTGVDFSALGYSVNAKLSALTASVRYNF
jgi:hypothetical protein